MLILDSDHLSLLEWDNEGSLRLRERLAECNPDDVVTTIVNYEEQMRGWTAYIARSKSLTQQVKAYARLRRHLDNYRLIPVLDFDDASATQFQRLRRSRIRIGTMDLKIAAIAISHNATLLSRNLLDFKMVPGPHVEDWAT